MWGSISSATGCAMNGMGWLRTCMYVTGSLVTFKAKLDHHLRNVKWVCLSCGLSPCSLPSWILLDMLDGSTVIR